MTTETTSANEGTTPEAAATTQVTGQGVTPQAVVTGAETPSPAGTEAASTPAAHVRPEGIPDEFWDDAAGLKVGDLAAAFRDLKAAEATRLADVPAADAAYDLALPADFVVPEGYAVEIKADDPLWAKFQEIGKSAGLPKGDFQKFVGAFAEYQIEVQKADVETYASEMTKLGTNAKPRVAAAESWIKANLPADEADALGGATLSAAGVKALERIIALKSGPTLATGVGGSGVSKFDGLRGGDLLDAVRTNKAA